MAAGKGSDMKLYVGATQMGSLRTKSFRVNNNVVDTTTDADVGAGGQHWSTKITTMKSFSMSAAGVVKGTDIATLRTAAMGNGQLASAELRLHKPNGEANGATLAGIFLITDWEESGEIEGIVEFSCNIENYDVPVWTPPSA